MVLTPNFRNLKQFNSILPNIPVWCQFNQGLKKIMRNEIKETPNFNGVRFFLAYSLGLAATNKSGRAVTLNQTFLQYSDPFTHEVGNPERRTSHSRA